LTLIKSPRAARPNDARQPTTPSTLAMLSATDLACSRGERRLFAGLTFGLDAGEWLHVRGENGSGKTTLLRTLAGLAPADAGRVHWRGADIRSGGEAYRRSLLYLGHQAALKDDLTARENLRLGLAIDGVEADDEALGDALWRAGLGGREDLAVRHLSAGQKRRVLLARLLLRPADLWVLDEPFNALDNAASELLGSLLARHLAAGGVAVLTSHQPVPLAGGQELLL
jgi:heme exporter protein A